MSDGQECSGGIGIIFDAINRVLTSISHQLSSSLYEKESVYSDLFLVDGYPICSGIPLVAFDVIDTILQIPVTLCQVNLQQIS